MLSRQEVAEIERYEAQQAFKENETRYGGRFQKFIDILQTEVEQLRKSLAFYLGENKQFAHKIETEYIKLTGIKPSERTKDQTDRLVALAKAISDAADASDKAYLIELDKY